MLLLFVGCFRSQRHASESQERLGSDSCACCHTETEVAGLTCYLTQPRYADTGPTSSSADPIPHAPLECQMLCHQCDAKARIEPRIAALEANSLPLVQRSCRPKCKSILTFHLSPRLCPSTGGCSPPSVPSHCPLSVGFLLQVVPSFLAVSSCDLLLGRPLDLFHLLGCHSVQRLVHPLSFILAICPAHFIDRYISAWTGTQHD